MVSHLHAGQNDEKRKSSPDVFDRYSIPKSLRKDEIKFFLLRMEWHVETALSDNWQQATLHPARAKKHDKWDGIELSYDFSFLKPRNEYYLSGFAISHGQGDFFTMNLRFEGVVILSADNKPIFFQNPLWSIQFSKNDNSGEFDFPSVYDPENPVVEARASRIEWDTAGKIIFDDYLEHKENFWTGVEKTIDREYCRELKESTLNKDVTIHRIVIPEHQKINFPQLPNDKEFVKKLNVIRDQFNSLKKGEVKPLLNNVLANKTNSFDLRILFRFENSLLYDVAIIQDIGGNRAFGEYILLDKNGVGIWIEGDMFEIDNDNYNDDENISPLELRYTISGSGTEIKFHPTGYPATYKTIVKNRLFGRQIEWNDKGEVISDVDQDIPVPWPDAPKKDDKAK